MITLRCIMWLWMVVSAGLGGWVGWMYLDDQPPYHYLSGEISPNPARQASRVVLTWQIETYRTCAGSVQRILKDNASGKAVAIYDPTPSALTVSMGDTELRKTFLLPEDLPPEVRYTAVVYFHCNPLQAIFPIRVATPEIVFRVIQ
jgi:hypothetical protein